MLRRRQLSRKPKRHSFWKAMMIYRRTSRRRRRGWKVSGRWIREQKPRRRAAVVVVTWEMRLGALVAHILVSLFGSVLLLKGADALLLTGLPPFKPGEQVQVSIGDDI